MNKELCLKKWLQRQQAYSLYSQNVVSPKSLASLSFSLSSDKRSYEKHLYEQCYQVTQVMYRINSDTNDAS